MAQATAVSTSIATLRKPVSIEDAEFMWHLRRDNNKFFFNMHKPKWDKHLEWFKELRTHPNFDFYIIDCCGVRVGTIAVDHLPWCEFLQNLCIDERYRGKGFAKWAVCQLMKQDRFIIAQVKPDNKHVIKMYEELGFWRVKR